MFSQLTTVPINGIKQARFTVPINGGTGPFKLTAITGVPQGMTGTISGNNLTITGKPGTLGTFNISATVTDANNVKLTAQFPIEIDATSIGNSDGVAQGESAAANLAQEQDDALSAAISKAATAAVNEATLRVIVSIESTANPDVGLSNPGYAGPFQVSQRPPNRSATICR